MPKFLRKFANGLPKRLRRGGKFARSGCRSRCCGATEFYLALRCDVYNGTPNPTIESPPTILIPAPYQCPEEECEINGGRIIVYSGQCYRVHATNSTFQPPPCDERRVARRWALSEFEPEPPPIVDPIQIQCKPLTALCTDEECLPVAPPGSCCIAAQVPACGDVQPDNRPCTPCSDTLRCVCGNSWYLAVRWNTLQRSYAPRGAPFTGSMIEELESIGELGAVYRCTGETTTEVVSSFVSATVRYQRGPDFNPACGVQGPGSPYTQAYYDQQVQDLQNYLAQFVLVCASDPRAVLNGVTNIGHIDCAGSRIVPDPNAFGGPCSTNYDDGFLRINGSLSAACAGGTSAWNSADREVDGFLRGLSQGQVIWSWGTVIRCPDGGQLTEPPPPNFDVIPLTSDIERQLVEQFGV